MGLTSTLFLCIIYCKLKSGQIPKSGIFYFDKMSKAEEIEKIIAPAVEAAGFEVVDIQFLPEAGRWVLRIFIDSLEGQRPVTLDDCQKVSGVVAETMENSDIIKGGYSLEVSSPGIERTLRKEKHFIRFTGKTIKVTTCAPIENQRNFTGKIVGFENGTLTIELDRKRSFSVDLKQIARAKLVPEIQAEKL